MTAATNRREVDSLTAQTPTWRRLCALLVRTLPAFGDAAYAIATQLKADRSTPFVTLARQLEQAIPPPAEPTARKALDVANAATFEERSLVCAELLATGRWTTATASELAESWGESTAAISNYRRAGQVARAAEGLDLAEKTEDTLGHLLRMQEQNERIATALETKNEHGDAARYRALALQARAKYAEVAGLVQQKVSVSIEVDPRFAGVYRAINGALDEQDRLERSRSAQLAAWVGEVALLTDGVLPPGMPEELPPARARVVAAVQEYERAIGARTMGAGRA